MSAVGQPRTGQYDFDWLSNTSRPDCFSSKTYGNSQKNQSVCAMAEKSEQNHWEFSKKLKKPKFSRTMASKMQSCHSV